MRAFLVLCTAGVLALAAMAVLSVFLHCYLSAAHFAFEALVIAVMVDCECERLDAEEKEI